MKGSMKSLKSAIVVMALGLLAMNTQAQYATVNNFSESTFVASLAETNQEEVETTKTGAIIISAYQEGAAIIKQNNKFGLINQQGYEICQPIYEDIHLYNHGYAAVMKHGKWTFVNKQGQKLTALRYDWVGGFENGYAPVLIGKQWGLLNEQGYEVVPTAYDAVKVDSKGAIWVQKGDTWKEFGAKKGNTKVATNELVKL